MAALEPYYLEPHLFQTPTMVAVKIVKWIIACQKDIADLVKDAKSIEENDINTAWMPTTIS